MLKNTSRSIHFIPLKTTHFPLLLKWINTDHVSRWWRDNRPWSLEDIIQKYSTYCEGYKETGELKKPIHAFLIQIDSQPIGFIQYYNAHDFPREGGKLPPDLPKKLAALDLFIGEAEFIGKGLSTIILSTFLNDYIKPLFNACFVDPDRDNKLAIRAYEKAGFQAIPSTAKAKVIWMVKTLS
ncbi:MAG TPA: GNAT family N-acetyltransferase [Alphaproteobacteria bacterium]|nr:GNAT family N-acetyltransferase [Alphaproteobacteria bacterium]